MRKFLEAAGYEVVEARDGEEGLSMVESGGLDFMILDLLMPKVDGMAVLRELHEKRLKLPIIIHTSDIQDQTRQECLSLGAVAFLNKPAQNEAMLAAIALALQPKDQEAGNASAA